MEKSTADQLNKSSQKNSRDLSNIISSAEFSDGPSPCSLQDGRQADLFGQPAFRASQSVSQVQNLEPLTNDTFCRSESNLSKDASPQLFLENKCPTWNGSTPRGMQWKEVITPSGRRFVEQIPLEPFKNADGSTGTLLPTPMASDNRNRGSINKTPSVTRRMNSGKQIGLSTLFDGKPCPFCVGAIMGYPVEWVSCAAKALATR